MKYKIKYVEYRTNDKKSNDGSDIRFTKIGDKEIVLSIDYIPEGYFVRTLAKEKICENIPIGHFIIIKDINKEE